jgi:hypothetical protein
MICDKLNYSNYKAGAIDFAGSSAALLTFAQDDAVINFMDGRHPSALAIMRRELEKKLPSDEANEVLTSVEQEIYQRHTLGILRTLISLPKDYLAVVAETMVNLTSFMRKVQMQLETVGGPIDIALISKKDGFVWIKRKHYFQIEYNPHFLPRPS